MNGFDLSTISALYVGNTPCSAIYKGANLIWNRESPSTDYIRLSTDTVGFDYNAGQQTVVVYSNISWSIIVTGGAGWVTVSPSSHSSTGIDETVVTISVTANTETNDRIATIQVKGGDITEIISVGQQASPYNPYYGWPVMPITEINYESFPQGNVETPIGVSFSYIYNKFFLKGYNALELITYQTGSWEFEGHLNTDYNSSDTNKARTDTVFYNRTNSYYYVYDAVSEMLVALGTEDPTK